MTPSMLIAWSAKNKIGFITGDIPRPKTGDTKMRLWDRCNDMVKSWILNGGEREIKESILFCPTAKDMWSDLVERFEQYNNAKHYQEHDQLNQMGQGGDSISVHFTKLKKLWDELRSIFTLPVCKCEAHDQLVKHEENQRVIKFLMGFNDGYNTTRGNILMMTPLPSLNVVYSILIQKEKQRDIVAPSPLNLDVSAMAARVWNGQQRYNGGQKQYYPSNNFRGQGSE
ncbi:uncharacterized protein LOC141630444 [Silene latifolia]|uniref:uncharacterized protein LOC141630444 n=1 Tax=Silene latifolia TaxID=37657 RepID=UPI003D773D76